ncbi:ATP-binding protein [Tepidibacter aestuarii]|uniref:ATP-binding protein n=1 Tax=Tepidibacter aestuarii TaxID=2925782 RepID=UPI0020C06AC2|nr:ATP-binding protein [Tepidibacter aestuarii]CAH2213041.1 PAS domain-containing sensor histidine kinase [Tepidibacter aestuarii]
MFCNNIDMKTILDNVPVPIIVFDNNNEIISINLEVIYLFNNMHTDLDYIKNYIKDWIKEELINLKNDATKEFFSLEKILKINEKNLYFKIKLKKIEKNIIVVLNDITSYKQTEIELKESKQHFRSVLQNMPIMMDAIDENDNIVVWNKECELVTGYSKEEIINDSSIWETLYPNKEYREKILNQIREMDCNFRDLEYDIVCKDGSTKTISWFNISKEFAVPGWYSWAFGIDVTNRKNTEESLRKKTEEIEKIFEALPDLYFRIDSQGIILDCKSGIHSDFDIITQECIGHALEDAVPQEVKLFFNKTIDEVFKTNNLIEKEFSIEEKGELKHFECRLIPLTTEEIIIIVRDISKRKLTKEAKKKAEENMKLLNKTIEYERLRAEFFANISHEFRTPINVILGAIQLMDIYLNNITDLKYYEKCINLKKSMKQNCYRLIRLVNNLIDITKIDSGFLQLNLTNYDIVKIVRDITFSISEFAKLKCLNLEFCREIDEKIIECDPDKIERILLNLLSNAIKFTRSGDKISVNIKQQGKEIIISLKDSGIGIKKENLDLIFERFRQVNKSLTRENEGSGIGLSLVKLLVEMHGGTIDVKSEYGKGSEFIVKLPVKLAKDSKDNNPIKHIESDKVEKISIEFSDIYF